MSRREPKADTVPGKVGANGNPAVAIDVSMVSKVFPIPGPHGTIRVLNDITFSVAKGQMLSIVGPSGSGKSTLLHCLAGLEQVSSGRVSLLGEDISKLSASALARLYRREIGFVFQNYNLVPTLSAWENVALPHRLDGQRRFQPEVDAALHRVGLLGKAKNMPSQLSGGEQQRVAIARALSSRPSVVFADEPTGALDSVAGNIVLLHLAEMATGGSTVVMVTHDLEAASRGDSALVLTDGRVVEQMAAPNPEKILSALQRAAA
jgi:putative ABC transport system ATP-binding protein